MRSDAQENRRKILEQYTKYLEDNSQPPTQAKLADITGLHRNTIANHLKEIKDRQLSKVTKDFKIVTQQILSKLAQDILNGDDPSASKYKLYLEVIENWSETQEVDFSDDVVRSVDINIRKGNKSD